jgi:geranylgeranyl reductase
MPDYDIIVVGGGPAGAVAALKCSRSNFNVLLVEKEGLDRHKPCGGILPKVCASLVSDSLGTNIPDEVMCSPPTLGLYYVPPSGRKNSGSIKNYRLINVYRDLFDQWLHQLAAESGVKIWYETEFLKLQGSDPTQISIRKDGKILTVTASYVIGADGVYSRVRSQTYGETGVSMEPILQEYWKAEGDFEDCFYIFFRDDVSPTSAYVIPKDDEYVIGVGSPQPNSKPITTYLTRFKKWLNDEFAFQPLSLRRREVWAIPFGRIFEGVGNTILVGDAAGFCNTLSGEGIRFAVESGVASHEAILETIRSKRPLATVYSDHVEELTDFIRTIHQFTTSLTDESKEDFVSSELARNSYI